MDCIHARMLILLDSRDRGGDPGELDAQARTDLDQHLERCADCLAWSNQESRVDEALGCAVREIPVPADLPSKILHTLEHRRPTRRLAWASAAAAACLLVGLGAYFSFWYGEKPELTVSDVREFVIAKEISSPQDMENWFAEMGLPIEAPANALFNFDLCNDYSIVNIKGFRVPCIEYATREEVPGPQNVAHVYVVDTNRYEVSDIKQAVGPLDTSRHRIEVLQGADSARYIYIAVYTGKNLNVFRVVGPI